MSTKVHEDDNGNNGYASDATASVYDPDDSDGESLSGSDLDEVEAIARVVRPQYVSDESIYTPVVASTSSSKNNKNTNAVDYRKLTQEKARRELIHATTGKTEEEVSPGNFGKVLEGKKQNPADASKSALLSSNANRREIVPEAAKNAFARDKNPKPVMIDIGSISAEVEKARQKKREADEEERKRLASLNSNRTSNTTSSASYHQNQSVGKKQQQEPIVVSPKSMAPSELAKDIFIHHHNENTSQQPRQTQEPPQQQQQQEDQELGVEESAMEEVADDQQENLDDRQEYYQFLDAIVKNKKSDTDRRTYRVPFSDESDTAAAQLGSVDLEARQKAARAMNERSAQMYATLARVGGHQHHQQQASSSSSSAQQSEQFFGGGRSARANPKQATNTTSTSVGTGGDDDSTNNMIEDAATTIASASMESDLAFQRARAFLEGMLLQENFIDAVNSLLEKAAPAFKYTKYTRLAGEFTLEQHRQWEKFCQTIEKMVLKKLHQIMDVQEFFQRIFDEDEKMQDDEDDYNDYENENQNENDDDGVDEMEDASSSRKNNKKSVLTHDAWEIVLSVMKFEAFCSLMDSYLESAMELEQEEAYEKQQKQQIQQQIQQQHAPSSSAISSSSSTAPSTTVANKTNNDTNNVMVGKPRPKAKPTLFHALPRSSAVTSSSSSSSPAPSTIAGGELPSSSSSSTTANIGPSALLNRQRLQAPRSAGNNTSNQQQRQRQPLSSSSTTTISSSSTSRTGGGALGTRNTTNTRY